MEGQHLSVACVCRFIVQCKDHLISWKQVLIWSGGEYLISSMV